ncbi:MAG TPA: UDP-N-acetylmuramoyl-tripeptide--D-alanyl-D-alanine ligase [Steroidobacteraceae bacterium]|nr:UDP-N-acetylmuramoyl-tripeptide--D-alanyl-D-alanine ligase [Steroidobacteraceae bacterium]HQX45951.1 UDP-N-acetylmuramoyl-tripeptide--D-alanyl-D-alanine ligase [Steroidobacteraceae bacterium]HQX78798.1 UDP-N-acetylmuramoyl-tripeptide--D-alanyl-D-alanine ligase [Steroidobacteraceae bacterium]HQZ80527.1 UDP-N-acetylmuramoyl-tripeptide--D-alanyl-D-alanine ligase [Steroidobacteraceae bacterium]
MSAVRTLAGLAADCGGTLIGADRPFAGVSTDTRTLKPGEVFVALTGPRFEASGFVGAAAAAGAAAVVIPARQDAAIAQIIVPDTLAALTRAAAAWRRRLPIPLVGVAGSNGKTTAKEMTAAILAEAGSCLATQGNLNNHIGVPVTLLRLDASHDYAVIEIGANRPGEVAALAALARPGVGLVTNAGAEHLEGFGSLEGVARAEGELFAALDPDGVAIVNADDAFCGLWRGMTRARIVTFGLATGADFHARDIVADVGPAGFATRFTLQTPAGAIGISLQLAGRHNVANALAAAAAAMAAGARLEHVARGLATMRAVKGRLNFRTTRAGAWLIDDSYNANPSSMRAGIDVLAGLAGRRWLAMGDMGELGEHSQAAHVDVGRYARERGVERLLATGPLSALAVETFGAGARWFPDAEALTRELDATLAADVRLLVKGSRSNRLERVVDALVSGRGQGN